MKKTCDICGGSGQISFFQGVSRFLLTVEECPECAGTGLQMDSDNEATRRTTGGIIKGMNQQERKKRQRNKNRS